MKRKVAPKKRTTAHHQEGLFDHCPDGNMRFAAVVFLVLAIPFLLWLLKAF